MERVGRWPDYLLERARRRPPGGCGVLPGSTAVVSFGNPVRATVASLGINPSDREFVGSAGQLLSGSRRRLATLESLCVASHDEIGVHQAAAIVDDCASYFHRRPYLRWFDPLDR